MAQYNIRVDTSFYEGECKTVVGVCFQILDTSCGKEDLVLQDTIGRVKQIQDSTEAELFGIMKAVEMFKKTEQQENTVIVLNITSDSDSAIKMLRNNDCRYEYCTKILSLVQSLYSINWNCCDRDKLFNIDTEARRAQRRVRDNHPEIDC